MTAPGNYMIDKPIFFTKVNLGIPQLSPEYKPISAALHSVVSIVGSLRDREVACSVSDRQGSNFESCVWRTVSSQSSHHHQEVLLAQFSLYVHKGDLKPDSFHFLLHSVFSKCGSGGTALYSDLATARDHSQPLTLCYDLEGVGAYFIPNVIFLFTIGLQC